MKKLEISQMENLQGGIDKCNVAAFMLGFGLATAETGVGAIIGGIGGAYVFEHCV